MRTRFTLLSIALMGLPLSSGAAVYRCTVEGETVYQATPCVLGQAQAVVALPTQQPAKQQPQKPQAEANVSNQASSVAAANSGEQRASRAEPAAAPPVATSAMSPDLILGMSDTKVLNMRGWGRPQNISRSKGEEGWREEWTYQSRAGSTRTLQFSNGKLAAINTDSAPQQVASQSVPQPVVASIAPQPVAIQRSAQHASAPATSKPSIVPSAPTVVVESASQTAVPESVTQDVVVQRTSPDAEPPALPNEIAVHKVLQQVAEISAARDPQ